MNSKDLLISCLDVFVQALNTEKETFLYKAKYFTPHNSFNYSNDNKYVVFVEGKKEHSIYGDIKVVDLKTGELITEIIGGYDEVISHPCFSPCKRFIGYIEGHSIRIYDMKTKQPSTIKSFKKNMICPILDFLDNRHLIYQLGSSKSYSSDYPLEIIDIETKKDVKTIKIDRRGSLYVINGGKKLLCEVGN